MNLKAETLKCYFEEVYSDGSLQNGIFLVQEKKLRYQYFEKDLYTLIYDNGDLYLIKNNDHQQVQKIQENTEMIKELIEIYNRYPVLENNYISGNFEFELEKSFASDFLKRISIKSPSLNLSLYFNSCVFETLHQKYFQFRPFFDIE